MKPLAAQRAMASVHRRVPVPPVQSIVRLRVRAALADPAKVTEARRQMGFLLARTRPDADLDHFARRYLEEMAWRGDVRWHPEMVVHQRIEGLEHLTTERDGSRGLVLNFMHHGQYVGSHTSMFLAGSPRINVVVHPRMFSADVPPYLEQHRRINEVGCRLHSREIGSKGIAGLLRGREIVSIASDVPGTSPVRFAGRRVLGSSGAARLALATDSPIVLVSARQDERGRFVHVAPPLEPGGVGSPESLLQTMVSSHERWVLAQPELADEPLSRWTLPADEGEPPVAAGHRPATLPAS